MSLDDFKDGNKRTSVSKYAPNDGGKYKNEDWLADKLENNTIQEIANECNVAYNSVYYQINKYGLNESDEDKAEDIERYISQFIDTDGTIQLNASTEGKNSRFIPNVSCSNVFKVEIASLIDAEGSLDLRQQKLPNGKLGYKTISSIDAVQTFHEQQNAALARFYSMIDTFCEHVGIKFNYSISERKNGILFRWYVNKWDDVATVLKTVNQHLVLKIEQAKIILDYAYPMYCENKHLTRDGFIKMAGYADDMAELRDNNGKRKYTQEYFKNKDMENW
jgi:hypothetical protein